MGEGAIPHVRLVFFVGEVGQLADEPGDIPELLEAIVGEALHAHLQLEIGDDGAKVCIAGALTVAVDGPLDLGSPFLDGHDGVGYGQIGVVMAMDTQGGLDRGLHLPDGCLYLKRHGPPIGITEHDAVRTRLLGGLDGREGVFPVSLEPVEEVFGVEDDFGHLPLEEGDGCNDHLYVFIQRDVHGGQGMDVPGFADDGHHLSPGVQEGADIGVFFRGHPLAGGAPKGDDPCRGEGSLPHLAEVLDIAGVRAGPSPLDIVNPELIEFLGDPQFVLHGKRDVLRLGSIPQGRIVDRNLHLIHFSCPIRRHRGVHEPPTRYIWHR